MRRGLLVLSLVGLTVLASAGTAQAQRRGYGGWGGGYYPQSGFYSSYYGGGYGPFYSGYGYGYSPGNYGYGYAPGIYYSTPNYVFNPTTYYSQAAPTRVVQSFYSGPDGAQQAATVTVVVPTADAQVWFGSTPTAQLGTQRLFQSPALEPGMNYTYTIKARWNENGKSVESEREVKVQAGQKVTVSFRDRPSEIAPVPDPARPN